MGLEPAFSRHARPLSGVEAPPLEPKQPSSGIPCDTSDTGTPVVAPTFLGGRMSGLLDLPSDPLLAAATKPAGSARKWQAALLASCVFHAAVAAFFLFGGDETVLIEGSQDAGLVMLGNAPEDETEAGEAGSEASPTEVTLITMLDATTVETVDAEAMVETADAVQEEVVERQQPVAETAPAETPVETLAALPAPTAEKTAPDAPQETAVARTAPAPAEIAPDILTARTVDPLNSDVVQPQPEIETVTPVDPAVTLPVASSPVTPAEEVEIEPLAPAGPQPARPVETTVAEASPVQPDRIEPVAEPQPAKPEREPKKADKPEPKPKETTKKAAEKPAKTREAKADTEPAPDKAAKGGSGGKGGTNAKKGVADGDQNGRVTNKGKAGKGAAGNASVSNYPGKVVAKLRRSLRGIPRSAIKQAKNDVQVGFTVNASGGVSGVRITRSSGSAALDQAALAVVRRAAPFPPIPADAGRSSWAFAVPLGVAR